MEAVQVFNEITASVEAIKNDDCQQFPEAANVGDYWRQGDIYIVKLEDSFTKAGKPTNERQLAPGNTQGSRHIVEGEAKVFERDGDALTGPVVVSRGCTVTHPEHGDVKLPAGVYGITYQRAYAEELKRVLD
jgi:hypothetical protein